MAGLGMEDEAPPAGAMPPAGMEGEEDPEQAIYERFVSKGGELIYADEKATRAMLERGMDNPAETLGEMAATIVVRVVRAAQQANQLPSVDVIVQAGHEILGLLAEAGELWGLDAYGQQDVIDGAWPVAMDAARNMLPELVNQQESMEDFDELQQEDAAGTLQARFEALAAKQDQEAGGGSPPPGGETPEPEDMEEPGEPPEESPEDEVEDKAEGETDEEEED